MPDIIKLSDKTGNAALMTVDDVLRDAIQKNEQYGYDKAVIILARHAVKSDGDEELNTSILVGGIGINDIYALGLIEFAKADRLRGFKPDN